MKLHGFFFQKTLDVVILLNITFTIDKALVCQSINYKLRKSSKAFEARMTIVGVRASLSVHFES